MDLKELRNEIDQIDDALVRLFVQRMEVSARIADYKKENDLPIFVPSREQEKLLDVAQKAGPDMAVYTRVLYDLLFELSRGYQSKRNAARTALFAQIKESIGTTANMLPRQEAVACLHTEADKNHLICQRLFGNCSILSFKNTDGILSAVVQGMCKYGLIRVEESIKQIFDRLTERGLFIVRSFRMADHSQYICVSRRLEIYPGADRSSIRMALSDRPGALYKVLSRLYTLGINVVRLESRPIAEHNFQGMFYFVLQTSVYSDEFVQLICELDDLCEDFSYLGSYIEVV